MNTLNLGERRQYTRVAFQAPATLVFRNAHFAVELLDLSLKGALVALPTDTQVSPGMSATLHVNLNEFDVRIGMEVSVAHLEGQQAGLRCQMIDIDSVTHLRRLVELNLGDQGLLNRELVALISDAA